MKKIAEFLLPFSSNVLDNVTAVIELLRTRPEAEIGLSCVRIYLKPNPTRVPDRFPMHYCVLLSSLSQLWWGWRGEHSCLPLSIYFPLFPLAAEHKSKCFLCEGEFEFLFQVLTSSVKSCGGSGDLIKPWRKLLTWVGYLNITLWNWENIDCPSEFCLKWQTGSISASLDQ